MGRNRSNFRSIITENCIRGLFTKRIHCFLEGTARIEQSLCVEDGIKSKKRTYIDTPLQKNGNVLYALVGANKHSPVGLSFLPAFLSELMCYNPVNATKAGESDVHDAGNDHVCFAGTNRQHQSLCRTEERVRLLSGRLVLLPAKQHGAKPSDCRATEEREDGISATAVQYVMERPGKWNHTLLLQYQRYGHNPFGILEIFLRNFREPLPLLREKKPRIHPNTPYL